MGGESSYPLLPSSQEYFVLVGQNASEIPYTILPGHPILSLNLQNNLIRHLPTGLLQLKTLILNDNSLQEISPELTDSIKSYESLQTLELAQNQLSEFKISIPSLKTLNLIQNRLILLPPLSENLENANFDSNFIKIFNKSSKTIKTLTSSLNYIEKIENTLKMEKLKKVDFSMNRISEIVNFSAIFPVIQTANFSFNLLKQVPNSISTSIVDLELSGNRIKTFSEDIQNLTSLQKLDISFNKLSEIPKLPKSLKKLYANNNSIQKVEDSDLPLLESFTFSVNSLEKIPNFSNHISKSLFFARNRINLISLEMVTKSVEQINLTENNITEIPIELFTLPNLRFLNLDSNKIKEIPNEIENSNISTLLISQNPIQKLPKLPKTLESFYACYCQIEDVSEIFTNCVRISKISLSGNKIKKFPFLTMSSTFSNLEILSLSQCDLDQFPSEFLINEEKPCKVTILDLSFNAIKLMPVTFSAPYLVDLDLSHNQIESIADIGRFPQLITLKIANNPISCNMSLLKNFELDSVDFTNIGAAEVSVPMTIREVLTSVTSLQPPYRHMKPIESGYAQCIGTITVNEDSICVRDDLDFYVVCDGHFGSLTATTAANILPNCFSKEHQFEYDFFDAAINYIDEKLQNEVQVRDGASIVCGQINHQMKEIITAHLGDSRALIVSKSRKVKVLTKPHITTSRREFERILMKGGRVVNKKTDGKLPVSRALADYGVVGVSNSPEFSHIKFEDDDKFFVLASGGVFKALTPDEIAQITADCDSAWDAAYRIKNIAFGRKNRDNISVIVVPLNFK